MTKILTIAASIALTLLPNLSFAASSEWISSGDTRMRLVVAEPQAGEKIIQAALHVELAPGWKTYWQDPGEAGVPLQIDLSGSQNLALKTIYFPAPNRFDDGVTVWAGYNKPVQFPIEFERKDGAATSNVTASIFIGICEKICVPFQTSLTVQIANAASSNPDQMAVHAAFAALPPQASEKFGVKTIQIAGNQLRIDANLDTPNGKSDLFLAAPRGWQFGTPKLVGVDGTSAQFVAEILFAPTDKEYGEATVDYSLQNEGKAVSGTANLFK